MVAGVAVMADLFWLTKAQIRRITPYFPLSHGMPRVDDQRVVSGILHVIRNGLRWRDVEWPPIRPDTGRSHEGLGLRLGIRLCRTIRRALKSSPAASAGAATMPSRSSGWSRRPCSQG
ncbi:MAG: hypothetical protein DI601_21790 [Azospirillum brasilense]|nr:MAG: hypothetical protein DI601_21790 [Azospirillum brasilense]